MPSLESLPPELLFQLLSFLRKKDLKNLCEVSKSLNSASTPKLYSSVTLVAQSWSLQHIFAGGFAMHNVIHIKKLAVVVPTSDKLDRQLINQPNQEQFMPIINLGNEIALFCASIPKDQLLEFSWNARFCVPIQLIGQHGCLLDEQKKLQNISVMTHHSCDPQRSRGYPYISAFRNLKQFRWNGPLLDRELDEIRTVLMLNNAHLEVLQLSISTWSRDEYLDTYSQDIFLKNVVFHRILEPLRQSQKALFPKLRHFSLCYFPFPEISPQVLSIFNFNLLQSLKLSQCFGVFNFLEGIVRAEIIPRLTSFEFVEIHPNGLYQDYNTKVVCRFLQSFGSLRDLFMMNTFIRSRAVYEEVIAAFACHKQNLQRLIFYQRRIHPLEFRHEAPLDDLGLSNFPELQCVGITDEAEAEWLWPPFGWSRPKFPWRIIHCRETTMQARDAAFAIFQRVHNSEHEGDSDDGCHHEVQDSSDGSCHCGDHSDENRELQKSCNSPSNLKDLIRRAIENGQLPDVSIAFYLVAQNVFGLSGPPIFELLAFGDFSYEVDEAFFLRRNERIASDALIEPGKLSLERLNFRAITNVDSDFHDLVEDNKEFLSACSLSR